MSWLKDYQDWCISCTDAPKKFHHWTGLSLLGSVVGSKVYLPVGMNNIYPNLWLVLVAPSSSFRKSTCVSIAKNTLMGVDHEKVLPEEWSAESLLALLERTPASTLYSSEFYSFTAMLNRGYMEAAKPLLTDIYDVPGRLIRHLNSRIIEINRPALSILSATTVEWMLTRMQEDDFAGGFIPRFIVIPAKNKEKTVALPDEADKVEHAHLIKRLENIGKREGAIRIDDDATYIYEKWYRSIEEQYLHGQELNILFSGYFHRLMTSCLKIALLLLLDTEDDSRTTITEREMISATNICSQVFRDSTELFEQDVAFTPYQRDRRSVLRSIRGAATGISRTNLMRHTRLPAHRLDGVLKGLEQEDRVEVGKVDGGNGRAVTWYSAIGTNNTGDTDGSE